MSTLEAAFQRADLIFYIYVAIVLVHGAFVRPGRRSGAMAIAVINHGGLIGLASTLAMPFISPFPFDTIKFLTGTFIEITCAIFFFMGSLQIVRFIRIRSNIIPDRYIFLLIFAKFIFFVANYLVSDGQYGIFSDDSRIDFLITSPLLARTLYLDMTIDFILLLSIGLRCLSQRTVRFQDLFGVLSIICITFLTGSKGASFLMIAYVILYIYAAYPNLISMMPKWSISFVILVFLSLVFGYIYILSDLLQVPVSDQILLTFSRFLLSADARIMAFDPKVTDYVLSQPHGAFIAELFRGPARLLGLATAEFPIGVYQYQFQVETTNFVGSTNQLSAMFVIYGGSFWLIEFFVVGGLMLLAFKLLQSAIMGRSSAGAWVAAASFFWLSDTFCKGFDAFVQLLPISMLIIFAFTAQRKFRWSARPAARQAFSKNSGTFGGAAWTERT
jgi:hypothetical protein